jgi:putative transposase
MARVWCGDLHRWCALTLVMDCCTRELLGWRLSPTGNAKAAEAALEEALINRYGILGKAQDDLTIRSDNGLVFTSRRYTRTVFRYGIKQEFIRPHAPQQNGMVERLIRSVKEQCLWLHNFASLDAPFVKVVVASIYAATSKSPRSFSGFNQTTSGRSQSLIS